jgi:hypothetical protein
MIKKQTQLRWYVGSQDFATLEDAQRFELKASLISSSFSPDQSFDILNWLFKNKDFVVDILTTTKNSKPSARKINGGTKKRKITVPDVPLNAGSATVLV